MFDHFNYTVKHVWLYDGNYRLAYYDAKNNEETERYFDTIDDAIVYAKFWAGVRFPKLYDGKTGARIATGAF